MNGPPQPRYSVDTSALIDWLERLYPEDAFPTLIQRVDQVIQAGRFSLSEEVWRESQAMDQATKHWCASRKKDIVVSTDASIAAHAAGITQQFPGLVNLSTNKGGADPFVIAVALSRTATVITGERRGTRNRPHIPDACDRFNVPCISFLGLIRQEGWKL